MNAMRAPQWHERSGAPVFEAEPVTVPEARRRGLLPSVANLLGVIARPAVDQSAEITPRTVQLCAEIRRGAERVARGQAAGPDEPAWRWIEFFRRWVVKNCQAIRWVVQPAIHQVLGYGATLWMLVDYRGIGRMLVDLKIQGLRCGTPPSTYRVWGYEMAACQMALRSYGVALPFRCLTLVMNSQEPHPPVEAVWSEEHLEKCRWGFLAARQLWVIENGYDPITTCTRRAA
jgi:hypothetical protein